MAFLLANSRKDLALKAAVILALIYVIGVAVGVVASVSEARRHDRQVVEERLTTAASFAAATIAEPLAATDEMYVKESLARLESLSYVSYAFAVDVGRHVYAVDPSANAYAKVDSLTILALGAAAPRAAPEEGGGLAIAIPAFHDGRLVGVARVGAPPELLVGDVWAALRKHAQWILLAAGIGAPLAWAAARRALRPIQLLADAARQVQETRRLDIRVDVRTGDQLQTLSESFNGMLERLSDAHVQMERLAFVDPVTGLPNKERARGLLVEARRQGSGAFLLVDVDRFKRVNETLGRGVGDKVLNALAARLLEVLRASGVAHAPGGFAARIGGAEFVIVAPGVVTSESLEALAMRIVEAAATPSEVGEHRVVVGASVGVARYPDNGQSFDTLLTCAEQASARAKRAGGNGYTIFEAEMGKAAQERMRVETDLRLALGNGEIVPFFQPKVDLRTSKITSCEALARWRRPSGELVMPGAFIPVAEETGLIGDVGRAVFEEACRAGKRWADAGLPCRVAVNVSALEFVQDDFAERVLHTIAEIGLAPSGLELEVTESIVMSEPERAISHIEPLRAVGVRFTIDDFGTGHSSLAYLTRLPFDVFKIDRAFVSATDGDAQARVIVETILAMARSLKYDTVAEGVETEAQLAFLRAHGCTTGQGWLFGKPVDEAAFRARLEAQREEARAAGSAADPARNAA